MIRTPRVLLGAALVLPLIVLRSGGSPRIRSAADDASLAIRHVCVVPMDVEQVLCDQTIVVAGDRIAAVGPDPSIPIPAGASQIDGRGLYALPGLIDMHVHVKVADLPAYLASGITSVRNMWGYAALPETIRSIASGELVGPMIYSASPGLDGPPPAWPETQLIVDPALADGIVAAQVAAGWRFIKVYNNLSLPVYDAIIASARSRGIRVIGHVPNQVPVSHALESGQASIEHLRGYDLALTRLPASVGAFQAWTAVDPSRMPDLAARTVAAGTWNCPTLAIFALLGSPDPATRARILENRAAMVGALHAAGARLLAGTDSGIGDTQPGTSLDDEIGDLVGAGLSPYEALRAATTDAAEFLEESAEIGTLAPGRRADILLVRGNPLQDVASLRLVAGVVLRGAVLNDDLPRVRTLAPESPSPRFPRVVPRSPS